MFKANKNGAGLDDSFIENEKKAEHMTQQDRNKLINDKIF
jgi:hypothetical protein